MREPNFARLCSLNAGIQLVWGAVLGISLQARTIALSSPAESVARYSALAAGGAIVATIVQLLAGRLSDHSRARGSSRAKYHTLGTAIAVPALVAFFLAPSFAALAIAFACLQGGINIVLGAYQAIIPDYVGASRRGGASAWMSAFQSAGNAAGLLVAGLVRDGRIVATALAAPLVITYAIATGHARTLTPLPLREAGDLPRARGVLGALMLSRGLVNVGFFVLLDYLLFFVRDSLHVAAARVELTTAFIFLTFTLAAIVGAVGAARPADRADKRLVASVAVGIVALSLAGLAVATSVPMAFACAGIAGIGWGAFVTADWALATAVLPARDMATAMGIWNVATTLPQVVAPLIAGPLVVAANATSLGAGPRSAIAAAIVAFVLGGIAIWRLPRV